MGNRLDHLHDIADSDKPDIFSEKLLNHVMHPKNVGQISNADGYGSAIGHCGDDMEIWLKVDDGKIIDAKFWTSGCSTTIATGSAVTEIIKGKRIQDVHLITPQTVLDFLGGLPEDHEHCAILAVNTVKEAIKDYWILKRDPWKKAYRPQ